MQLNLRAIQSIFNNPKLWPGSPKLADGLQNYWVESAESIHVQLQRACLPTNGRLVKTFLADHGATWSSMGPGDVVALLQEINREIERRPSEWKPSARLLAMIARIRYQDWLTPNIWDRPELFQWREQRADIDTSDLSNLFTEMETILEAGNYDNP